MCLLGNVKGTRKEFFQANASYNVTANKLHRITVPKGKVWQVLKATASAGTSSTISVRITNKAGNITHLLTYMSAGVTYGGAPATFSSGQVLQKPVILWEDESLEFNFGTAQADGTDWIFASIFEVDESDVIKT